MAVLLRLATFAYWIVRVLHIVGAGLSNNNASGLEREDMLWPTSYHFE